MTAGARRCQVLVAVAETGSRAQSREARQLLCWRRSCPAIVDRKQKAMGHTPHAPPTKQAMTKAMLCRADIGRSYQYQRRTECRRDRKKKQHAMGHTPHAPPTEQTVTKEMPCQGDMGRLYQCQKSRATLRTRANTPRFESLTIATGKDARGVTGSPPRTSSSSHFSNDNSHNSPMLQRRCCG